MSSSALTLQERIDRLGVPTAEVIEDVDSYLKVRPELSAEDAHQNLQTDYRKYRMIVGELTNQKEKIAESLPNFNQCKAIIEVMKKKKEAGKTLTTQYKLADEIYQTATVEDLDSVILYMGAYVMVEYPLDEAETFMNKNITEVTKRLTDLDEELEFVANQVTTTEVSMAHFINHIVLKNKGKQPVAAQ
uniref:Prefoldin subunit 3 n=1 Tax=Rhabditophanes sp. KR3021 TaxID=114890 RepID=A0AC35TYT0_9BILA